MNAFAEVRRLAAEVSIARRAARDEPVPARSNVHTARATRCRDYATTLLTDAAVPVVSELHGPGRLHAVTRGGWAVIYVDGLGQQRVVPFRDLSDLTVSLLSPTSPEGAQHDDHRH